MARVISVVNQKGGVGKTTSAINLGAYLADAGKFVLLVDMDPQGNASSGIGAKIEDNNPTVYESLVSDASLRHALVDTAHVGYKVAPANSSLSGANVELINFQDREFRLAQALLELRNDYDYIIIDCPPSLGLLTINALVAADEILIPIQAEYYALEGVGNLLRTINLVRENLKPSLQILGAFLTMFDQRNRLSSAVFNELYQHFPNKIFRSVVPRSVRVAEAPSFGKSLLHYDPDNRASRAYEKLAREIIDTETLHDRFK